jgi:hypothetical protein
VLAVVNSIANNMAGTEVKTAEANESGVSTLSEQPVQQPSQSGAPSKAPRVDQPSSSATGINDILQSLSELRRNAASTMDNLFLATAHSLSSGAALAMHQAKELKGLGCKLKKDGEAVVDVGLGQLKEAEDAVIANIKAGMAVTASLPTYVTYPALGIATFLILPWTRSMLYNATIGRLRSPESIASASAGRVEGLRSKLEEVSSEAQKLQAKMQAAEEQMREET